MEEARVMAEALLMEETQALLSMMINQASLRNLRSLLSLPSVEEEEVIHGDIMSDMEGGFDGPKVAKVAFSFAIIAFVLLLVGLIFPWYRTTYEDGNWTR